MNKSSQQESSIDRNSFSTLLKASHVKTSRSGMIKWQEYDFANSRQRVTTLKILDAFSYNIIHTVTIVSKLLTGSVCLLKV